MVTRPLFPELSEYTQTLSDVWESKWLSNRGNQHNLLEQKLKEYIKASNISLFCNGTIALMTAVKSLDLKGEVITTPFTFPATSHVLPWNNIKPVFCDIDPIRLTIDPNKIESLITDKTTAILGTHVYGIPCHVKEIQEIADSNGLKVIYDGAHAFTTVHNNKPISEYGDITMFSFHPTKLFQTGEGGALVFNDPNLKDKIEYLKNFGIKNQDEVLFPGINGKMNELQAAMGLNVLPLVKQEQQKRSIIRKIYTELFEGIKGITVVSVPDKTTESEQYFCIRINESELGESRQSVYERLRRNNVFARKYFYPLVSDYPCYSSLPSANKSNLPIAYSISNEVLCLPFYSDIDSTLCQEIANIIIRDR